MSQGALTLELSGSNFVVEHLVDVLEGAAVGFLRHVPKFRRVTLLICAAYECTGVVMRPEEIDLKAAEIESNSGATTHLEESPTRKA